MIVVVVVCSKTRVSLSDFGCPKLFSFDLFFSRVEVSLKCGDNQVPISPQPSFFAAFFLRGSTHGVAVCRLTRVVLVTRASGAFFACLTRDKQKREKNLFLQPCFCGFSLSACGFLLVRFSFGSHACSCKQTPERGKARTHTHFAEREKKRGANPFCRRKPAVVLSVRFFPSVVVAVLFLLFVGIAPGVQHGTGNHTAFRLSFGKIFFGVTRYKAHGTSNLLRVLHWSFRNGSVRQGPP